MCVLLFASSWQPTQTDEVFDIFLNSLDFTSKVAVRKVKGLQRGDQERINIWNFQCMFVCLFVCVCVCRLW